VAEWGWATVAIGSQVPNLATSATPLAFCMIMSNRARWPWIWAELLGADLAGASLG
jgi:hypothetical protein